MNTNTNTSNTSPTTLISELLRAALDRQPTNNGATMGTNNTSEPLMSISDLVNIINGYTRCFTMYNRNIQMLFNLLVQLVGPNMSSSAVLELGTFDLRNLVNLPMRPTRNSGEEETARLTQEDIARSTETIPYRQGNSSMTETRCPIGLTNFRENEDIMRIRRCGHYFNPANLRNWLANHDNCPVCRRSIVGITTVMTDAEINELLNSVEIESDSDSEDDDGDDHQ